jgi:hypothetical protein
MKHGLAVSPPEPQAGKDIRRAKKRRAEFREAYGAVLACVTASDKSRHASFSARERQLLNKDLN